MRGGGIAARAQVIVCERDGRPDIAIAAAKSGPSELGCFSFM